MAQLFADENFDFPVVIELRRLGHDVLTIQDIGLASQGTSDRIVLDRASADFRAVLTFNRRHFHRLHLAGAPHAGIITCTRDPDSIALALRIQNAVRGHGNLQNVLIRIIRPNSP